MFSVLLVIWNRFVETRGDEHWSRLDTDAGLWELVLQALDLWSGKNLNCKGIVMFFC